MAWNTQERQEVRKSEHDTRVEAMDAEWYDNMPCNGCNVVDVCKHAFAIKRQISIRMCSV